MQFSLIPYAEICKLIYGCLLFLNNNLSEANVNLEDLKYYELEQNATKIVDNQPNSPSSIYSPSQFALMNDNSFTRKTLLIKNRICFGKGTRWEREEERAL